MIELDLSDAQIAIGKGHKQNEDGSQGEEIRVLRIMTPLVMTILLEGDRAKDIGEQLASGGVEVARADILVPHFGRKQ